MQIFNWVSGSTTMPDFVASVVIVVALLLGGVPVLKVLPIFMPYAVVLNLNAPIPLVMSETTKPPF